MLAAKARFTLDRVEGGKTVREHLLTVQKQTRDVSDLFQEAEVPSDLEHLFTWFSRLSQRRRHDTVILPMGGAIITPQLIDHSEMESMFRLHHLTPSPWEIHMLEKLDLLWMYENRQQRDSDGQ